MMTGRWISQLFFMILSVLQVTPHLNLFITQPEVKKLLGLAAELFYVRDGVINTYAVNFTVPVPAHLSDLYFSWQALSKQPLSYAITINYDNPKALFYPELNISSHGFVPTKLQTFRLHLQCTGKVSAEVQVQLHLNVSTSRSLRNETSLTLQRNKICLTENSVYHNDSVRIPADSIIPSSEMLYVAVACACAMIVVVIAVTSLVYVKSKKIRRQESLHPSYTYGSNPNVFIRLETIRRPGSTASGSYATIASFNKMSLPSPTVALHLSHLTPTLVHNPHFINPIDILADLEVPRESVILKNIQQEGTFGLIYHGYFKKSKDTTTEVLIKTVSDQASKLQVSLLLCEGTIFSGLSHNNVLSIIAANTEDPKHPLLIYQYANKGNLKKFLESNRTRGEEKHLLLTQDLVDMAIQVVLAMMFLQSHKICHRDLATRNCVVDEKLRIKVTDSALSRDLFPGDYHCLGDNENRPIKWLAVESLLHKEFSGASDVWSFGVLLWELITLAQQPYAEIDPFEMAIYLKDGYRLPQPINCPDELFSLMACCWLAAPNERPTFVRLLSHLQEFYTALGRFI